MIEGTIKKLLEVLTMKDEKNNKQDRINLEKQHERGLQAYKKTLRKQREFCEKHGLRTATYAPLKTQKND